MERLVVFVSVFLCKSSFDLCHSRASFVFTARVDSHCRMHAPLHAVKPQADKALCSRPCDVSVMVRAI